MKFLVFFTLIFTFLCGCSTPSGRQIASTAGVTEFDLRILVNQLNPYTGATCPRFSSSIEYPNQDKWNLCCVQHDIAYWKGGTNDDRLEADKQLRSCIIEQNEPNAAGLVYLGARHGDTERANMTHRWGYGWTLNRGYTPITADDKIQISRLEKDIPTDWKKIAILSPSKNAAHPKDTLTGNFCVDAVLTFIQHHLHRTLTPMRVEHHLDVDGEGFLETVKINDQLYGEPYEFKFFLTKRNACTLAPNRWPAGTSIKLKSFNYK